MFCLKFRLIYQKNSYKLICIVTIVQNSMQGYCQSYRCLWDKQFDKVAAYIYETPNLIGIATLYAFYYD